MSLKRWAASLVLAFSLVATGCRRENDKPVVPYRDPQVITDMIDLAIATTDTGTVSPDRGADFKWRMIHVLRACNIHDLQTLQEHGVTISLDQRLSKQEVSFFFPTIEAAWYKTSDSTSVLTLWDDGKYECETNAYYIHVMPQIVRNLANKLRQGPIEENVLYCGRFKNDKGEKNMEWRTEENGFKKTLKKNPVLRAEPCAVQPSAVPPTKRCTRKRHGI